jgi:peroxiredoxin
LRDRIEEIRKLGAELVAVGTGRPEQVADFIENERVNFLVLSDDKAEAANAASIESASVFRLFHPNSFGPTLSAWKAGHRIGTSGRRVTQLGATFVVGPGADVHYEHYDEHPADHAPLAEIFAALERVGVESASNVPAPPA